MRHRITVGLGALVAGIFLALGCISVFARTGSGGWYWSVMLLAGGLLMLIALFRMPNRPELSLLVMGAGAAIGSVPALTTLLLPPLAFTAVILRMFDLAENRDAVDDG